MRDGGYAAYPAHKADHERLLDEIRDLMDDYEDGEWVDLEGFGGRLEQWFSAHFAVHDALLHQWSSSGPGLRAGRNISPTSWLADARPLVSAGRARSRRFVRFRLAPFTP